MLCIVFKMYIIINTQRSNYGEKLTGGGESTNIFYRRNSTFFYKNISENVDIILFILYFSRSVLIINWDKFNKS